MSDEMHKAQFISDQCTNNVGSKNFFRCLEICDVAVMAAATHDCTLILR